MVFFLSTLLGCGILPTQGGDEPAPSADQKVEVGKQPVRTKRTLVLPGRITKPPPPAEVIGRSDCKTITDGGKLYPDGWTTGTITCGETVIGHTRGGVKLFDTRFYEYHYCTPATTQHSGGDERVYRLQMPEGRLRAWVTLDTPCDDLDVAALKGKWKNPPSTSSVHAQCEMGVEDRTKRETLLPLVQEAGKNIEWLIIVEGKGDAEGAFALTVQCDEW
jgi:hypothetical protein